MSLQDPKKKRKKCPVCKNPPFKRGPGIKPHYGGKRQVFRSYLTISSSTEVMCGILPIVLTNVTVLGFGFGDILTWGSLEWDCFGLAKYVK